MSRTLWAWARILGPVVTLAVLLWRLGTGPFLDGIRTIVQRYAECLGDGGNYECDLVHGRQRDEDGAVGKV